MKPLTRCLFSLSMVAVLFASVGCSSAGSSQSAAPAPTPQGKQAEFCRALHKELPATVNGLKRRSVGSDSDYTAFWGDPAISLRCGVKRPLVITEGYRYYNPRTPTIEINDVEWMPEQQEDGSIRCTTSKREAWVEVTVPNKYTGAGGEFSMFDDLSEAVKKTIPFGYIA
ncbi:DUF3515 domain-containing protein [Streptomyces sp. NPDC051162]|uniref:DUF3515 domain-containing protein n=1 Tax=Streptomyces sp. NPDC051162 TaxID=3154747 RepID=UPI0034364588